jgi:hypothetical protein
MRNGKIKFAAIAALAVLALSEAASAYYSPRLGRFLSRDPIGEPGAVLIRQEEQVTSFRGGQPVIHGQLVGYGPFHHRFIARDPITSSGTNRYGFVENAPTGKIDILGMYAANFPDPTKHDYPPQWPGTWINGSLQCRRFMVDVAALFQLNRQGLPGGVTNDKFAHCYITCRMKEECGELTAGLLATVREAFQQFGNRDDSIDDMLANADGLNCAAKECPKDSRKKCRDCCARDQGKPGNMYLP